MDEQMIEPCPFCGWQAHGGLRTDRGLTLRHDGKGCVLTDLWFQADLWNHRAAHSVMAGKVAELEQQRLMILAAVYGEAPRFVATICDEKLDRSGKLLGEVRALARAALAPYPERRSE